MNMTPNDHPINTFAELMHEIAYDWMVGSGEKALHKDKDEHGYWINKTSIYERDGKYYLEYKMNCHEVSKNAFRKLEHFYDLLED